MKKRKISNRTKGKLLILGALILVIGLFLAFCITIVVSTFFNTSLGKKLFYELSDQTFEFLATVATVALVMAAFAFLVLFVNQILPMLCFFIAKPFTYFKIWCICVQKKYSCRFRRPMLASLISVSEKADIEIKTKDETLHIHLIDIPFPFLRMFLLANDREYCMHRSYPGKLRGFGGFIRPSEQVMDPDNYTIYTMPELISNETEKHYLVISPSYANVYFIENKKMLSITGECTSGNITVCRMKVLKRHLKSKLHSHID
jgi:hypothetical protein